MTNIIFPQKETVKLSLMVSKKLSKNFYIKNQRLKFEIIFWRFVKTHLNGGGGRKKISTDQFKEL